MDRAANPERRNDNAAVCGTLPGGAARPFEPDSADTDSESCGQRYGTKTGPASSAR